MRKLRKADSAASPVDLPPEGTPQASILEHLGAARVDIPRGFWVYTLHESDGTIFYVGRSGKAEGSPLIRRLADKISKYGDQIMYFSVIQCRDENQMMLREDFLIDELQPAENIKNTVDMRNRQDAARKRNIAPGGPRGKWLLKKEGTEG